MDFKYITKQFLPPVVIDCWSQFKAGLKPVEWEYLPEGWPDPGDPRIKGWDVESVARVQKTKFSQLLSAVQNGGLPEDARVQHTLMAYAYVLTLAAARAPRFAPALIRGKRACYAQQGDNCEC